MTTSFPNFSKQGTSQNGQYSGNGRSIDPQAAKAVTKQLSHRVEDYVQQGDTLQQQGSVQGAIVHYQRAIQIDPNYSEAYQHLAEAFSRQGNLEEAAACYRQAIALEMENTGRDKNPELDDEDENDLDDELEDEIEDELEAEISWHEQVAFYAQQAGVDCDEGDWQQAINNCEQALEQLKPIMGTLYNLRGRAFQGQGNLVAAEQAYRQASVVQPQSAEPFARLGSLAAQQQQWQQSVQYYQQAISLNAQFAGAYWSLAEVQLQLGDRVQAALAQHAALRLKPHWISVQQCLQVGDLLLELGRLEQAIECYQWAIQRNPKEAQGYHQLGAVLGSQGRWQEAVQCHQRAVQCDPQNVQMLAGLAQALTALEQWQQAIDTYRRVTELEPNQTLGYVGLRNVLVKLEQWEAVLPYYQKLAQLQPNNSKTWHELGDLLNRLERWSEATEAFQRAIDLNPGFSWSHNNLGDALLHLERWEEAAEAFQRAIELNPDFHWSHYNLGSSLAKLEQWDGAVRAFQRVIELQPDAPSIQKKLGDVLRQRAKQDQLNALEFYRQVIQQNPEDISTYHKALDIKPDDAELCVGLANSLRKQGNMGGAAVFYQMALQLQPNLADAATQLQELLGDQLAPQPVEVQPETKLNMVKPHIPIAQAPQLEELVPPAELISETLISAPLPEHYIKRGQTLEQQGNVLEAIALYTQAIALYPQSAGLYHHLGVAFATIQRWEDAVTSYIKVLEISNTSPFVYDHLGQAWTNLKQWDQAIDAYQKAILLKPDFVDCYYSLGKVLTKKGELQEAIAVYQKILELNPQSRKAQDQLKKLFADKAKHDIAEINQKLAASEQSDYQGFLDVVASSHVAGWVRHKHDPDHIVFVDVFVGNCLIGTFPANKFRQDLADGLKTHGCHKFEATIPPSLNSHKPVEISVKVSETGQHLRNSPVTLTIGPKGKKHDSAIEKSFAPQLLYQKPKSLEIASQNGTRQLLKVGIVILNLDGGKVLEKLFTSFKIHNSYPSIEFIVIDHGSIDDSVAICERWAERLPVKVINRGQNYSFSASNNYGAAQTDAPLLLFLNNDITICQDLIPELVSILQDPKVGIVGCKLLDIGSDSSLALPPTQHLGVQYTFESQTGPGYPFEVRYAPQMLDIQSAPWCVPIVTGAIMMCRREDFEAIDGFNEDYFYGYEDVELCLAFNKTLGKEIVCANHLSALHHRGYSRFSGKKSTSFVKRIVNNKEVLDKNFGYFVRRSHLEAFFDQPMFWTSHALRIAFAVSEASMAAATGDYFTAHELGEYLVREHGWDVFYLSRDVEWYDLEGVDVLVVLCHDYDLRQIENAKPSLVKVAWARNWFQMWASIESAPHYDAFWCSSQRAVDYIQTKLSKQATLLPIATNAERFTNLSPEPRYQSDYCFTGSYWGMHREIIDLLDPTSLPFDFALYGYNWDSVEKFKPYHRGGLPYPELPKVYASTKIVVDDANSVTKEWGSVNSRVFDAIVAGALVITNGDLGSQEVFGGLLPTYDSKESLESLLREYLTDEPKRLALVAELQKIVQTQHTYRDRAHTVFAALRDKLSNTFRVGIKIGTPSWDVAHEWGDYHFALAMKRAFERQGHSVRIDILPEWENPQSHGDDVAIVLRGLSGYTPKSYHVNLMWNISHPDKVTQEEYEQYDHIFVASEQYAEELRQKLSVPVQALLQCTDPDVFYPELEGDKLSQVLFVGNSRKVYRPIVRDAIEAGLPVDVYGTNWDFLPPGYLKGEHIPNEVLRHYYSRCGVLLNDHWETMQQYGFISNRLFDAAACGATIVSDAVTGLEHIFGDFVTTYENANDLAVTVQQSLNSRSMNQQQRLNFADYIRTHHSFNQRVAQILNVIELLHAEKMRTNKVSH